MTARPVDPRPGTSPASCAHCGATTENPPLNWVLDVDARRSRRWFCDRCARTHLRAIEAKLEPEWW